MKSRASASLLAYLLVAASAGAHHSPALAGWSAETLKPGERISADVSPARNPARTAGLLLSMQRADGTVLLQRNRPPSPVAQPAAPATGLAGSQNCVSLSAPFLLAWSDLKQIEVRADAVIVRAALIDGVERVIHLGEPRGTAEPTQQGHSVGRWEGGALLVETTHFLEHGLPH